jgi:hypothetical protein
VKYEIGDERRGKISIRLAVLAADYEAVKIYFGDFEVTDFHPWRGGYERPLRVADSLNSTNPRSQPRPPAPIFRDVLRIGHADAFADKPVHH